MLINFPHERKARGFTDNKARIADKDHFFTLTELFPLQRYYLLFKWQIQYGWQA